MVPVPLCLACGARSKSGACPGCGAPHEDAVFRKLPRSRLPLIKAFFATGLLGFFLTAVGVALPIRLVIHARVAVHARTPLEWALSTLFVVAILGFGVWLDAIALRCLAEAVATRWEVFGRGGMVSGVVTTLRGHLLSGALLHDRAVHRPDNPGVTSAIVEQAGFADVLICGIPGMEHEADLTIWSALAGLVTLDLAGVVVVERRAWSKASIFRRTKRAPTMTTLLLEHRPAARVPPLAPPLEKRLARALDALAWSSAPKVAFDLVDVLHQMKASPVDTPLVAAPLDDAIWPTRDVIARLSAFREEARGPELRFDAVPAPHVATAVLASALLKRRPAFA